MFEKGCFDQRTNCKRDVRRPRGPADVIFATDKLRQVVSDNFNRIAGFLI
jgi:hypothetical protein